MTSIVEYWEAAGWWIALGVSILAGFATLAYWQIRNGRASGERRKDQRTGFRGYWDV